MLPSIMKHTPAVCALAKPTTTMRATAFCARIPICTAVQFPCRNWMRQARIPFVGGRSQSESLIFLLSGMRSRFRFRSDRFVPTRFVHICWRTRMERLNFRSERRKLLLSAMVESTFWFYSFTDCGILWRSGTVRIIFNGQEPVTRDTVL